jgi:hypothetical protein
MVPTDYLDRGQPCQITSARGAYPNHVGKSIPSRAPVMRAKPTVPTMPQ